MASGFTILYEFKIGDFLLYLYSMSFSNKNYLKI